MKTFRILILLILFSNNISGQLQVDAGDDTIICVGLWGTDTTYIGGNPTAFGGDEPYTYSWSTKDSIGSFKLWASYFLDDTTSANPRLTDCPGDRIIFYLDVWDNLSNHQRDSISVRYSRYSYLLMDNFAIINKGDTTTLWGAIRGGIEPLSFSWSPNYNISDTSIIEPLAWPDTSTDYTLIVTDSIGCKSMPEVFVVIVNPVDIDLHIQENYKSEVIPNPININSEIILNTVYQDNLKIMVFKTSGQVILYDIIKSNSYKIGEKINSCGVYTYIIFNTSKILTSGKFVKN
jgi:hypothetical protein